MNNKIPNKDKYGNLIYNESNLFDILYTGYTNINSLLVSESTSNIIKFNQEADITLSLYKDSPLTIAEFDHALQNNWFIPDDYKNLDIFEWVRNECVDNPVALDRVNEELAEFEHQNLTNLLKWAKFFVDTCRSKKIIWGVGRGSSVASYVLYVIGIHRIDSIKYDLDYKEFLR
jgi:DNA polymerase III alpha subunit